MIKSTRPHREINPPASAASPGVPDPGPARNCLPASAGAPAAARGEMDWRTRALTAETEARRLRNCMRAENGERGSMLIDYNAALAEQVRELRTEVSALAGSLATKVALLRTANAKLVTLTSDIESAATGEVS